jgi:rhodanese-related sulfurtransferase
MHTITSAELFQRFQRGEPVDLLDVRTPAEYHALHVGFAINAPLERLDPEAILQSRNGNADEPLYVICKSGNRAKKAIAKLTAAGAPHVVNVEGGTTTWLEQGFPVERGKHAVSLERQVRIAAGLFVLLGVVLGYFVHPLFIGLSAFVGAGLVFAGITDTCGMGMLLAKMPWNQRESNQSADARCSR